MSLRDSLEFDKELHSLYETKLPVSASKIAVLTKLAVKHAKQYKNVIFSIEKFVQKCPPELKLAGLYVIDSIARAIAKRPEEGESYVARFEEKLDLLIPLLLQAPAKDKEKIKRTIGLWKKSALFNVASIMALEAKYFTETATAPSTPSNLLDPRLSALASSAPSSSPADPRLASVGTSGATTSTVAPTSAPTSSLALDPSILQALGSYTQQQSGSSGMDLTALLPFLQQQAQQQAGQNLLLSQLNSLTGNLPGLSGQLNGGNAANSENNTVQMGNGPNLNNHSSNLSQLGSHVQPNTPTQPSPATHRAIGVVGSLPSHWTSNQTPPTTTGHGGQPPSSSTNPSTPGSGQQQQQGSQATPTPGNVADAISQARSIVSRWGAGPSPGGPSNPSPASTPQGSGGGPIGRPIPVVGSDRESSGAQWQQAAKGAAAPVQEGDCAPGFIDPSLPKDFMKVLTRTVYVGGITPTLAKEEVRDLFETVARVDTVTVNYPKFNAFIKFLTRAEAELIKEKFNKYMYKGTMLKMGWGCGYGPKEFFDYTNGETLFPMSRMSDAERRTIATSPRGGGQVEGGMVVEEPDFGWPQKGEVCKGRYAAGNIPYAPGWLEAVAQRARGGFNNNATGGPTAVGGSGGPSRNFQGMPPIPLPQPPMHGVPMMPSAMPPFGASNMMMRGGGGGGPPMPPGYRPHSMNNQHHGNGGIVVVSDRQYDDREERQYHRPKQSQDRGEEHIVVLGGGADDDEKQHVEPDHGGHDQRRRSDERLSHQQPSHHNLHHQQQQPHRYEDLRRMSGGPGGPPPHAYQYPSAYPMPPPGFPMPPRPPPHWNRGGPPPGGPGGFPGQQQHPQHHLPQGPGGARQWGPPDWSAGSGGHGGSPTGSGPPPNRKRPLSPEGGQDAGAGRGEDRGDEEGRRSKARWE